MIKKYVLAFAFDKAGDKVVLVVKDRPEWQKGKINGVGGKVEDCDNYPSEAMSREFYEETGVAIDCFESFGSMEFLNDVLGGKAIVYLFRAFTDKIYSCKTKESEEIVILSVEQALKSKNIIPNLQYLIPMLRDKSLKSSNIVYK